MYDYQGRSWIAPPSGVRAREAGDLSHDCYIPKKCIKKYTGHTKGVTGIQFYPGTGTSWPAWLLCFDCYRSLVAICIDGW